MIDLEKPEESIKSMNTGNQGSEIESNLGTKLRRRLNPDSDYSDEADDEDDDDEEEEEKVVESPSRIRKGISIK